jgi:hypothetical protein
MVPISNVQSIEKLNGNNFRTWKMKMEFFLHEKEMWEITLGKLLPLEVEFGEILLEGSTLEHCLFVKKEKLACGTILLIFIDIILHHVTQCVETIKDAWDNLCATFEKTHVGNKLQRR